MHDIAIDREWTVTECPDRPDGVVVTEQQLITATFRAMLRSCVDVSGATGYAGLGHEITDVSQRRGQYPADAAVAGGVEIASSLPAGSLYTRLENQELTREKRNACIRLLCGRGP